MKKVFLKNLNISTFTKFQNSNTYYKTKNVFNISTKLFSSEQNNSKDIKSNNNIKIYTKTGDKGTTSLIGGQRLKKNNTLFDILGDIDELNSYIGIVSFYK